MPEFFAWFEHSVCMYIAYAVMFVLAFIGWAQIIQKRG